MWSIKTRRKEKLIKVITGEGGADAFIIFSFLQQWANGPINQIFRFKAGWEEGSGVDPNEEPDYRHHAPGDFEDCPIAWNQLSPLQMKDVEKLMPDRVYPQEGFRVLKTELTRGLSEKEACLHAADSSHVTLYPPPSRPLGLFHSAAGTSEPPQNRPPFPPVENVEGEDAAALERVRAWERGLPKLAESLNERLAREKTEAAREAAAGRPSMHPAHPDGSYAVVGLDFSGFYPSMMAR